MKPTERKMKIHASKEKPVLSTDHGYLGKHANEPTVLIPLEPIREDRGR